MRRAAISLLGSLVLVSVGCGGDSAGPSDNALVGVYTLLTIDGDPPPVIVEQEGEDTYEITGGVVTLEEDGTFSDITDVRITVDGVVSTGTESAFGTWTRNGNTITFNVPGEGSYTMTWNGGDRLTQDFFGSILVYER